MEPSPKKKSCRHRHSRRSERATRRWWKHYIMLDYSIHGDTNDPVIEKLLETVNNENDQELEQVLKIENNQLERIRQTDIRGASLLHYACSRNNTAVADVLIRYGFDVNKRTTKEMNLYIEAFDYVSKFRVGTTPIYIATVSGLSNVTNILAKNGANVNIADIESYTPLHNAAWHSKTELIRQLLANGAKVNAQDSTGSTPLRKAAYRGHIDSVKQLLVAGADPNIRTKKGRAAIHCAALYGHTDIIALLLAHGATVNIQDNDDITPLHAAVYNGKRLAVRLLLKSEADVNRQSKFGNTPLHLACMEKWFVIVGLLAQAGGNYNIENRFGETPISIMETGNAGKRVCCFGKSKIPSITELERMEAEHRDSQYVTQSSASQVIVNGIKSQLHAVPESANQQSQPQPSPPSHQSHASHQESRERKKK
ncbi:serine/threonine-protein phosphatase 6 regulatory ankyrin repeat subunit A-like isoform X1 [Watersipora subatra]|uniref:serine/threonine-protein phosphatase 6 regulatory ankyrin repeat subunit A-like isoform X1 n=1 Tax=Watersipora subatra TaxID=2589382 RepID=UPI00355AE224